ncbi:MAG: site-specific DNA-methyltransferase [Thermanaeromonas sp.]|uniref:DNA methyltransferase n=1 Tax=Thermanaeromonas sp. TaxID=2003697 RepID=UPI00243DDE29|nr:site-specific DNA-methyltransferase [Thermanaeromonas sp.]MCG0277684.1 site-specific DNA-methyltransferase [Thermanaeromonas sp.]
MVYKNKNRSRCELVYQGKASRRDILENTPAARLQPLRIRGEDESFSPQGWKNMLVWGDNLPVLKTLLQMKKKGELKDSLGRPGVTLIYIDPPFSSRQEYTASNGLKAYEDTLTGPSFIEFLRQRLLFLYELLTEDGSIYVHLDERKSHYIKVIMDEIFGEENFQREIVWRIGWVSGFKTRAKNWIRNHDVLLFYTKSPNFYFHKLYLPYPPGYRRRDGQPPRGKGYPLEDTWNCYPQDRLDSIQIMSFSGEKTGFPTQKNENLLERIILASSRKGDIVLDAFCGSGTTLSVAEKLERRWIGIDNSEVAISITETRLLNLRRNIGNTGEKLSPRPFILYRGFLS